MSYPAQTCKTCQKPFIPNHHREAYCSDICRVPGYDAPVVRRRARLKAARKLLREQKAAQAATKREA